MDIPILGIHIMFCSDAKMEATLSQSVYNTEGLNCSGDADYPTKNVYVHEAHK